VTVNVSVGVIVLVGVKLGVCVFVLVDVSVLVLVAVSVLVLVGTGLRVCVGVAANDCVGSTLESWVIVKMAGASVGDGVVNAEVAVGVAGEEAESTANAVPTMSKFTKLMTARIAPTIRRVVSLKQILLFFSIDYPYSSALGHCSPGQN